MNHPAIKYSRFVKKMQHLEPKSTPGKDIEQLYQEVITPDPAEH